MTRQQTRAANRRAAKIASHNDWLAAMDRRAPFRRYSWRDLYVEEAA